MTKNDLLNRISRIGNSGLRRALSEIKDGNFHEQPDPEMCPHCGGETLIDLWMDHRDGLERAWHCDDCEFLFFVKYPQGYKGNYDD